MSPQAGSAPPGPLVVIVEDDPAISEGLALNLKLQGFRTEIAADGETAWETIVATGPDLVLLDITLPKQSGLWVLDQLRQAGDHVPVIVLSARQDEYDKVAALQLGADDYVTKPFAVAELLARVHAVLRRAVGRPTVVSDAAPAAVPVVAKQEPAPVRTLSFGDVVIDLAARTVAHDGTPVKLTHLEFQLLSFLCRNASRVFTREELLREVWGFSHAGNARTVDNFIAQLRSKLETDPDNPRHLLTVRGSGYRFDPG